MLLLLILRYTEANEHTTSAAAGQSLGPGAHTGTTLSYTRLVGTCGVWAACRAAAPAHAPSRSATRRLSSLPHRARIAISAPGGPPNITRLWGYLRSILPRRASGASAALILLRIALRVAQPVAEPSRCRRGPRVAASSASVSKPIGRFIAGDLYVRSHMAKAYLPWSAALQESPRTP